MRREDLIKIDEEMVGAYMDRNIDVILSHCADDVVNVDFGEEPVKGKEALRAYLGRLLEPFSENTYTRVKRIVDGNELFAEIVWSAKNTGELQMPDGSAIPATGKTISISTAYYARVNDQGRVVEMRGYSDNATMMSQLGLTG